MTPKITELNSPVDTAQVTSEHHKKIKEVEVENIMHLRLNLIMIRLVLSQRKEVVKEELKQPEQPK